MPLVLDDTLKCTKDEDMYISVKELLAAVLKCESELINPEKKDERFVLASEQEVEQITAARTPKNTCHNTSWGMRVYKDWAKFRNSKMDTLLHKYASVPESFSDVTYERISNWLS